MRIQRKCLCNVFWINNYEKSILPPPLSRRSIILGISHILVIIVILLLLLLCCIMRNAKPISLAVSTAPRAYVYTFYGPSS